MKSIKIILNVLVIGLTVSCSNKNGQDNDIDLLKNSVIVAKKVTTINGDTVIVGNLTLLKDTIDFPLSAFLSDFQLIDLEDSEAALVKETGGGSIAISSNYIGIYSGTGYKLFNKKGRYITTLSSRGQGPNEYIISIYDSYIDEQKNKVYLLPMNGNKILVYDLKGNAQSSIPLAHETTKGKFYLDSNKKLLYMANMPFSNTASAFWVQDFKGNLIKEITAGHLAIIPPDYSNEINMSMNTTDIDYSLFHWQEKSDTLYHYRKTDNRLVPVFTVDFKDHFIQHDYIELPDYYIIRLIETKPDYHYTYVLIDKNTLKGSYIKLKLDMLGNIDAPEWIQFDRGFYNANVYADYLQKQWACISDFSAYHSDLAQYIQDIQQSDVEDLNNIILIGKLKENRTVSFTIRDINDYKGNNSVIKKETSKGLSTPIKKRESVIEDKNPDKIYSGLGVFSHIPLLKGDLEYFRKNNRYKNWDSKNPKVVMVGYVVEKNGKASNVIVKESSGIEKLDKEALRLVKEARYTVGKLKNGKEVRAGNMLIAVFFPPR